MMPASPTFAVETPPPDPGPGWAIQRTSGRARTLIEWIPEPVALVRFASVTRPAVMLGSTQAFDVASATDGRDVVRRRSGGGAVWLDDDVVWVDVVVPAGHRRWEADVGRAFHWLGDVWCRAIDRPDAAVHRGPFVRNSWSSLVCFAGVGPGEVTIGGRKVVGISQRRTRAWALFQCAALLRWDPAPLVDALASDRPTRDALRTALADVATGWPRAEPVEVPDRSAVERSFIRALVAAEDAGLAIPV